MSVTLSDDRVSKVIEEICLLTVDFFDNKGGTTKTFSSLDPDLSGLREEKVFLLETPKRSFKGKEGTMGFGTTGNSYHQNPTALAVPINREGIAVIIDNFDSFTYNVVQLLGMCGAKSVAVRRNNVDLAEITDLAPTWLVISPGPGSPPHDTGVTIEAIQHYAGQIPILGICLGHQAIGHMFGGQIVRAKKVMHGKTSQISHNGQGIFAGIPNAFTAARYHSLVIDCDSLPDCLEATAASDDGEIMAVCHRSVPALHGIQFHPESIITEHGKDLMNNFLDLRVSG
ncbi:MAG: aminodeoxychorismate/anthranilate synthase component II [Patescibacteria group bacterium]|jgi:para-aminobenzoate synthetase component 2|nr:aminodeoxychorismate/anthranilate synthase component II [Patescibacteria group bacterium]